MNENKFCDSKNETKIYYVINYAQKKIYIFLKNITSNVNYKILKNMIEYKKYLQNTSTLLRNYYNYFENNNLLDPIDFNKGKEFYLKYIIDKILKDISDFKDKNPDFTYKLIDDSIYNDDTNKIILSKIAIYCFDNIEKDKYSYEKIFAWFNKSGVSYPIGFNNSSYPLNTEQDKKFKTFIKNHINNEAWDDSLIDENFVDDSNEKIFSNIKNEYNDLLYNYQMNDNIIFFMSIIDVQKPEGFTCLLYTSPSPRD